MDNVLHFEKVLPGEDCLFLMNALLAARRVSHVDVDAYYYIQNESSFMHKYGKIHHSKEYAEGCLAVAKSLDRILREIPQAKLCYDTIDKKCNDYLWSLLLNAAKFLPLSENMSYISEMRAMGRYPLSMRGKSLNLKLRIVHRCMCIYPLWILIVACLQILPMTIKYQLK